MSSYPIPLRDNDVFNPLNYNSDDTALTIGTANDLYLQLVGGTVRGLSTFNAGLNTTSFSSNSIMNTTSINTDSLIATTSISGDTLSATTSISAPNLFISAYNDGVDTELEILNTANTTNSGAVLRLATGSLGGDPRIEWYNSSGTIYNMGTDMSDSKKLVLSASSSLGTNNVMTFTNALITTLLPFSSTTATDMILQRASLTVLTLGATTSTFAGSITSNTLTSATATDLILQRATVAKLTFGSALTTFADSIECDTLTSKALTNLTLSRAGASKLVIGSTTATFTNSITADTLTSKTATDLSLQYNGNTKLTLGIATATFANSVTVDTITSKPATDLTLSYAGSARMTLGNSIAQIFTDVQCGTVYSNTISSQNISDLLIQRDTSTKITIGASNITLATQLTNSNQPLMTRARTTNQSISDVSDTVVQFDTQLVSQSGITHSSGIFTATNAGTYLICGQFSFASNSTGNRSVYMTVNNTGARYGGIIFPAAGGGSHTDVPFSAVIPLNASDNVRVYTYQSSGGSLNIIGATYRSYIAIYKIF